MATNEETQFGNKWNTVIRDITVNIVYNGKTYEIVGKNSVEITSNVTNDVVYSNDGTGSGVAYQRDLNRADEVKLICTQPSDTSMELLHKIYKKKHRADIVILSLNGSEIYHTLKYAVIASGVFQNRIDESPESKIEILFRGRLSCNMNT